MGKKAREQKLAQNPLPHFPLALRTKPVFYAAPQWIERLEQARGRQKPFTLLSEIFANILSLQLNILIFFFSVKQQARDPYHINSISC